MRLDQRFLRTLTELTSNKELSHLIGAFTKTKISRLLIPLYAKTYAIRVEEAEKPLNAYRTLNDFFIRRLKSGVRKIDQDSSSLVSPVDATITGIGRIDDHLTFTVKGQSYKIEELLEHSPYTQKYNKGCFIVLYLSPADYHRIHSPVTGTIIEKKHVLGKTYPVNEFGLKQMHKVLSRNERLITYIRHKNGTIPVIKVGAMNVSSIKYSESFQIHPSKGHELAYFEFGSTVVLLIENGIFEFCKGLGLGSKVFVGEPLGYWRVKDE